MAMLFVLFMWSLFGADNFDAVRLLSTFSSSDFSWFEPVEMLALGVVVFPFLYAKLVFQDLPGRPWQRGMLWGVILWALWGAVVMPVMGQGLFCLRSHHLDTMLAALVGHAIYGIICGGIAGDMSSKLQRKPAKVYARSSR
jgi:hypothetical protein